MPNANRSTGIETQMDEEPTLYHKIRRMAERNIAGDIPFERKPIPEYLQIQNWDHSGIHCEPLRTEVSLETSAIYAAQSEDGV